MNNNQTPEDWMKNQLKQTAKTFLPYWIAMAFFSLAFLAGGIYFIFWCLKHFGII